MRPGSMLAGMLIGVGTGFALWIGTDTFALFPAFIGVGFVLGLVFSAASRRRGD